MQQQQQQLTRGNGNIIGNVKGGSGLRGRQGGGLVSMNVWVGEGKGNILVYEGSLRRRYEDVDVTG